MTSMSSSAYCLCMIASTSMHQKGYRTFAALSIFRPFFSEFFGRANRALSSQFYRAQRQNSEPGKKTILGGRLPKLCVGRAGGVRKFAKEHLGRRSDIKITCKCKKKNSVTDQQSNRWTNEWTDQQMDRLP